MVALYRTPSFYETLAAELSQHPEVATLGDLVDEAETGAAGIYRLQVGEQGLYTVLAGAKGWAPQEIALEPLTTSRTLPSVTLPETLSLEVTVTGGGKPLAGALVALAGRSHRQTAEWSTRPGFARTDETGRAQFDWPEAEMRQISVAATGFVTLHDPRSASTSNWFEVRVEPAESEILRLHDAEGRPLPGLIAALSDGRLAVGRSDEEGRVEVWLPPRPDEGEAEATPLRVVGSDGRYVRGTVAAMAEPEIDIEMPEPLVVDGRVFDAETREPLADALVWGYVRESDAVRADRQGRFRLVAYSGLPFVSAGAAGYQSERSRAGEGEAALGLKPIRALLGRVVDRQGLGVAGAEVVAEADVLSVQSSTRLMALQQSEARAFSDSEGRFRLDGLLADASYDVSARRIGYAEASKRVTFSPDEPGVRRLELRLDPGRVGVGRVVDEWEEPVAGARVALYEPEGPKPSVRIGPEKGPVPVALAFADSAGEFRLADLGAGSFRLEVEADGFAPLVVPGIRVPGVEVEPYPEEGAVDAEVDLGVAVLVPDAEIRGRVVDAEDQPIAGASVFTGLQGPGVFDHEELPVLPNAVTGADGTFVLDGLEPGVARRVVARHADYIEAEVLGVVPAAQDFDEDEEVVVVLFGPSTLSGSVTGPDGEPVSSARVRADLVADVGTSYGMKSLSVAETDDAGAFVFEGLPAGKIQLVVQAEGYQSSGGHVVQVEPGRDVAGVEIQLERGAVAAGRVLDSEGQPVPRALVVRKDSARRPGTRSAAHTGADGTFRFEGLPPGELELMAQHEELGFAVEKVELQVGRETYVEFELGGGASISGQVATATGEPATGAIVGLRPIIDDAQVARFSAREVPTRSDGQFEIPSVGEGRWILVAEHPEYGSARSDPIDVGQEPVSDLYLELEPPIELTGEIRGLTFEEMAALQITALSEVGYRVGEARHDGTYRVGRLSSGTWRVVADVSGRQATGEVDIPVGVTSATLDLDFAGGHALDGVVRLDGKPVDGAEIHLEAVDQPSRKTTTDHLGRFHVEGLEAGPVQLLVTHLKTGLRAVERVEVPHDEPMVIDVETSAIFGQVVDETGASISGVTVSIEEVADGGESDSEGDGSAMLARIRTRRPEITDARGEFRCVGLTEGTWRLTAEKAGFAASERTLTLQGGADLGPVTFVLGGAGSQ